MRILLACMLWFCMSSTAFAGKINTQEVDRRINKLMSRPDMAGLSVAIVENGELIFSKGYGETLKGSGDPVTADTVFRWASVSKGVAAATVLELAEDGHFGLSSPISAHALSLHLPPSQHAVTVEDILSHRTGLVYNAYDKLIEENRAPKDVRASMGNLRLICQPGDCHTYQNVAFDAVGEMTETATGVPYKSSVAQKIFRPLKMDTATVTREGLVRSKSWAKPHNNKGVPIAQVKESYYHIPAAAGVNSSVNDMAKWMLAQMDVKAPHLKTSIRTALQTPRVATPRENRILRQNFYALRKAQYGLGWRIYDYEGHRVIGHRGAVEGYRASILFDPEKKTGVAILWNSPHGRPVGLQLEIMDQVYGKPRRDWMRLG